MVWHFRAIANYNHRNRSAWGVGGDIKTEWKKQIDNHWDKVQHKAKNPFKPLKSDAYGCERNNIEAFKKLFIILVHKVLL